MICDEHCGDGESPVRKIFVKLRVVVVKTGRFQRDHSALLLEEEHFVVDEIVGFVRVQFYAAEIVDIHLALCKLHRFVRILVELCRFHSLPPHCF